MVLGNKSNDAINKNWTKLGDYNFQNGTRVDISNITLDDKNKRFRRYSINPNSYIDINLEGGWTYIVSTSGNAWSGVYIIQMRETVGSNMEIYNIITAGGWSVSSVNSFTLRISNTDPNYTCSTYLSHI